MSQRPNPPTVLVTQMFTSEQLDDLRLTFPDVPFVQLHAGADVPPEGRDASILFRCTMTKPELLGVLNAAPALRWIHTCTAGFDQLLIPEVHARGVLVTRSSDAFNAPMAEFALAFILLAAKNLRHYVFAQARHAWDRLEGRELADLTVGIVGAGAVGTELARRCAALGIRVIGTKRTPEPLPHFEVVLPPSGLPTLLEQSDFVVLAAPLTPETQGMIGADQFHLMKASAYLINVARGALVDESALIAALREHRIAGACVDAFAVEPLGSDHPFWDADTLLVTPHVSYWTPRAHERSIAAFKRNLHRYLADEPLADKLKDAALGY